MGRSNTRSAYEATANGYRVEAPRSSDAIGNALRNAYDREPSLPDDMSALLQQLNGADSNASPR